MPKRKITATEYKEWIVDEVARCAVEGFSKIGNSRIFLKNLGGTNHG